MCLAVGDIKPCGVRTRTLTIRSGPPYPLSAPPSPSLETRISHRFDTPPAACFSGALRYYETIAGGAGAGPTWSGCSGVHTHMTNTRITDPEILERRCGTNGCNAIFICFVCVSGVELVWFSCLCVLSVLSCGITVGCVHCVALLIVLPGYLVILA